ncbi:LRR receptor-like serine/threonine-protein kinase GSO2 [Papaver somniferum]|uniref:LRR receptor-like serine/threonine-protein kinase GSO2 n=1 Tax=Papaver somniferum TaxID=3469 RepID=UPI000E6FC35F|nr:LRR receptor-like serine/threonine-protein kinase GSO2 [Papaver somniferum]
MELNLNRPLVFVPLLLCLIFFIQSPTALCCHENERTSLLTLKSFLTDPSNRLSSWQGKNCCNWHRIHCSNDSLHVVSLDLRNPDPETFVRNVASAVLSTSSQSVTAGNGTLGLHIIDKFELVEWLTEVNGSIPSSITNASSLVSLDMLGCAIQGSLPASISNLSRLQKLELNHNNIAGFIPPSISKLKKLQILSLTQNNLQGFIPESTCEMSSLQQINLGRNNLTGTIPSCIGKLRNLQKFHISGNSVGGSVSLISLLNELNLTWISLSANNITAEVDVKLVRPKFGLQILALKSCNLQGHIPTFICNLPQLVALDLSHNNLRGAIPSFIFELQNLSYLDLSKNNLQGTLPPSLNITLQFAFPTLNLANNKLQGHLPLPPQKIGVFDLSYNNFTGAISDEIGQALCSIGYVSLSDNKLSGSIPSSMCANTHNSMMHLDLSNNELLETIPSSLQYCNSLISLNLAMNSLTGNIPHELERMKNLKTVLLDGNALNGTFPTFIQQLQDLEVLNLGNNKFGGSIPNFIGTLKIVVLRSNEFSGSIPEEITRVELQIVTKGTTQRLELVYSYNSGIDLSCNFLEGNIPLEMGLLKGLAVLNLAYNHFYGKSIGSMRGLESLDLSFNKVFGDIPMSLTSIDPLGYLNLSYNNLSGTIPRGNHFDTLV